jgi:hypothetical protein
MNDVRYFHCVLCMAIIVSMVIPVSANIRPTSVISRIYFENNGIPYNEPLNFSMECYGYPNPPGPANGSNSVYDVFSLSAACPSYGCEIFKRYWSWKPWSTARCRLNGTTQGDVFVTSNISEIPQMKCVNIGALWEFERIVNGTQIRYNLTPEYSDCQKKLPLLEDRCQQYLTNSSPDVIMSNMTHHQCISYYNNEKLKCYAYLKEIDTSWTDGADKYCEYRFNISLKPKTPENAVHPGTSPHFQSPVASLYCSLLNLFGARC